MYEGVRDSLGNVEWLPDLGNDFPMDSGVCLYMDLYILYTYTYSVLMYADTPVYMEPYLALEIQFS